MPDTVKSWIEERRGIHAAASEGPWSWRECPPCKESGREDIQVWSGDENEVVTQWMEAIKDTTVADDANAIVDAHNMFPRALNALEQVLELHRPEAFEDEYNMQSGFMCESCYDPDKNEWIEWPCETIRAIEGAINE